MITVIKPGLLTSIQDLGRFGYQKYGIVASGAMDTFSHRIANLLVGNEENQATLEITLHGPVIQFEKDALISICGGDLSPMINGEPVHMWRCILIKQGCRLSFGPCKAGCRSYLAVAGGFKVPEVMHSQSTYLRAGIGGFLGRALKGGDRLQFQNPRSLSIKIFYFLKLVGNQHSFTEMVWSVSPGLIPPFQNQLPIRIVEGREFHLFSKESREKFLSAKFNVTTQSDRMGYRLNEPVLQLKDPVDLLSEAVSFGTIQVPSEGKPIVLLADRQTTGGYPKIAQIASVDFPKIAQAKPGNMLSFHKITHKEAQLLYIKQQQELQLLRKGIQLKFC